jgi:hypothetical protein
MEGRNTPTALTEKHFGKLKDPRGLHSIDHSLIDIIIITKFFSLGLSVPQTNTWHADLLGFDIMIFSCKIAN